MDKPNLDPTPVALECQIILFKDGRITLHGPLEQPIAMLGLLELAKETYANIRRAATEKRVVGAASLPTAEPRQIQGS